MSENIRFYELSGTPLTKALPQLLYKVYDSLESPMLLLLEDEIQIDLFNNLLWTFSSNKFLAHGIEKDGKDHIEPLFLTAKEENLNQAKILVSTKVPTNENFAKNFSKKIYVFPKEQSQNFLNIFHQSKENGIEATYWQQDASGKWHSDNAA